MTGPAFSSANILAKGPKDPGVTELYQIGEQIGKGAFGIVHACADKRSGAKLACKTIQKTKLQCQEDVKDVQSEVAIMNLVAGHPNVVTLRSTHEDKEAVHLVMELCSGGELFDSIVESGSFSEKKAAFVFRKMLEVVRHCHELGVMHRDLKPENFLLTSKNSDAELKLTDFGLSVFFKPGEKFRDLVGSPYYVAPEVLRKNYSFQCDMWSLGVILYILLSGLPPFWGDNEEQIFKMVLKGNVDFRSEPWPHISDAAKDCVKRLLEVEPSRRPSCSQILKHDWLIKEGVALDVGMDSIVLKRMSHFSQMNKMKKMALMVVGQCLSADEVAGLKELFKSIDTDGSGSITMDEMRTALMKWDHKINQHEVDLMMKSIDVDGNGTVDYNEFVAATMQVSKLEQEELLQRAFKQLDLDGSGTISTSELEVALKEFGIEEDVATMMKLADTNNDGQIDYEEFTTLLRRQQSRVRRNNAVVQHDR